MLADIADELRRIDEELKLRDLADVSTEFLLYRKTYQQAASANWPSCPHLNRDDCNSTNRSREQK